MYVLPKSRRQSLSRVLHFIFIAIAIQLSSSKTQAQNNALSFDGDNSYIEANSVSNALSGASTLSMEAWIWRDDNLTESKFILTFHQSAANAHQNILLFGTSSDGKLVLSFNNGVDNDYRGATIIEKNKWTHIAITISADNTSCFYVNGVLESMTKFDTGVPLTSIPVRPVSGGCFSIGQDWDGSVATNDFIGKLDEIRVWNTVRSADEIRSNMYKELTGNETGLEAYYNMNAGSGSFLTDNSAKGNTGTLINSPLWITSGAFSGPRNALSFDGVDDYVSIPTSSNLDILGDITLEAWVKMDALPSSYCRFICKGSTDNNEANNILYALNITSTGVLEFAYEQGLGGAGQYIYLPANGGSIPVGVWQHIAVVRKQSSKEVTFYVDGKQFGTIKTYTIDPTGGTTGKLTIGAFEGASAANPFNGEMDEVRIWSKTRTASEIRETMMQTLAGTETGLEAYYRFDEVDLTDIYDLTPNGSHGEMTNMDVAADRVSSDAFTTWLGVESSAWAIANNWSDGVPSVTANVGIYKTDLGNEIAISDSPTVDDLMISATAIPTLSTGLTVNGNLILKSDVDLNGQDVVLGNSAFLIEENGTFYGASGTISTTRNLSNISSENVAGLGAIITTAADMGSTTIVRGHNAYPFGTNNSTKRYFDITPTNNIELSASLSFLYRESELNGNTESGLELFKSTDNKSTWINQNGTVNTTSNMVSLSGISAFSSYTLIEDTQLPSASITYSPTGPYHTGDNITLTATFSEDMKDAPVPQIAIGGSNTVNSSNMVKTSSKVYTYSHTVQAGPGDCTISLSTGTDLAGNVVESNPTSGATFTIENQNPAFTSTPVTSVNDNQSYEYSITASDEDGDGVLISGTAIPSWLSLSQSITKNVFAGSGSAGSVDGIGVEASFSSPTGVDMDNNGNMYVADYSGGKIRKITPEGNVSTLSGAFSLPNGIAVDDNDNIFVTEWGNRIKKISSTGIVSTFAGSGVAGYADGIGTSAQFSNPSDVEVDAEGNLYVSEHHGNRIRKITPAGEVSILAGSIDGTTGSTDGIGTAARFNNPTGIALDGAGNIYVADFSNNRIRKITSSGVVSTFVTGVTSPRKLEFDAFGNLLVSLQNTGNIIRITPLGNISTFESGFLSPNGLVFNNTGDLFLAEYSKNQIQTISEENILKGSAVGHVGVYPVSLKATDTNGGETLQNFTITVSDVTPPAGYSASINQDPINSINENAVSFTLIGAELGSSCNYAFTSSNGGTPVSQSVTVTSTSQTISGINLSGLEDGTITLTATLTDAAGNKGSDATDTSTKDTAPPSGYSVSLDQSYINSTNKIAASFTFADAEIGATYNYSITSNNGGISVTGSGTVVTATNQISGINLSGLNDGTLTLTVTLTDVSGNKGSESTDTSTKDAVKPDVTITATEGVDGFASNDETLSLTFTTSEATTDFAAEDITVTNGTLSNFNATSTTVYTATFTPTNDGASSINIEAGTFTDEAGSTNTAATEFNWLYDNTQPYVTIAATEGIDGFTSNDATLSLTFTTSEATTDFTAGDITFTNGTLSSFNATSATIYTATFTPTNDGASSINIESGKFADAVGNTNTAATEFSWLYDNTHPDVTITATEGIDGFTSNDATLSLTFTTSEATPDFAAENITVANGTLSSFNAISTTVYIATFTPTNDGASSINIEAGKFTDEAGNTNTAAMEFNWLYDHIAPAADITYTPSGDYDVGDEITITATFNENLSDLPLPQISLSGGNTLTPTEMTKISTTEYSYTYTVTSGDGPVTVSLTEGLDLAGNVLVSSPVSGETFSFNSAPIAENNLINTDEDVTLVLTAEDFRYSDPDDDTFVKVQIISWSGQGELFIDSDNNSRFNIPTELVVPEQEILVSEFNNLMFLSGDNLYGTNFGTIVFKVSDGSLYSTDSYTLTIDVNPINDIPVLITQIPTIHIGSEGNFYSQDFSGYFGDREQASQSLTYSIKNQTHTTLLSAISFSNSVIYITPKNNTEGETIITLNVSDNSGSTIETNFKIVVTNTNTAPYFISEINALLDGTEQDTTIVQLWDLFADAEDIAQELVFEFPEKSDSLELTFDSQTGELAISTNVSCQDSLTFLIRTTDSGAISTIQKMTYVSDFFTLSSQLEQGINAVRLGQNSPNPVSTTATIGYYLPERSTVSLALFNSSGQLIKWLINQQIQLQGEYGQAVQCYDLLPGIYYYQLTVTPKLNGEPTQLSKKMIVR